MVGDPVSSIARDLIGLLLGWRGAGEVVDLNVADSDSRGGGGGGRMLLGNLDADEAPQ